MSDYGFLSRALHRLALGIQSVGEASFDIERGLHGKALSSSETGKHVFVAGLARSGTTMLMRFLYETGEFCSLTYRDMPFVLAPNTWAGLSGHGAKSKDAADRAHGDGVLVDFDSPEALEEVFWRIFCGERYIRGDRLCNMRVNSEDVERFRTYISLILMRYSSDRYLSKNNNNILRLDAIKSSFPKALILIPFRTPEQQAYSLLTQHKHFTQMHQHDAFSAQYMRWLVHHEFGSDHRPFELGNAVGEAHNTLTVEYWLTQWVRIYKYLLDKMTDLGSSIFPVGYEMLCTDTPKVWKALNDRTELSATAPTTLNLRRQELPEITDKRLLGEALDLFHALEEEARKRI